MDAAGKTTYLTIPKNKLENIGEKVYTTKQPTDWYRKDNRAYKYLRGKTAAEPMLLREPALFSAADRLRHYQIEILPNLKLGKTVLTDRYVYKTYAYFLDRGVDDLDWMKYI